MDQKHNGIKTHGICTGSSGHKVFWNIGSFYVSVHCYTLLIVLHIVVFLNKLISVRMIEKV